MILGTGGNAQDGRVLIRTLCSVCSSAASHPSALCPQDPLGAADGEKQSEGLKCAVEQSNSAPFVHSPHSAAEALGKKVTEYK